MSNIIFTKKRDTRLIPTNIWSNVFHLTDYLDSEGKLNEISNIFNSLLITGEFLLDFNNFEAYIIQQGDTWEGISNKAYDTVNAWWIILMANEIQDPFSSLVPGKVIRILDSGIIDEILYRIEKEREE